MPETTDRAVLTTEPVGRTLRRMTGPMMVGILAMIAFNLVDRYFVSRLSSSELAAMGFIFPVVLFVASLALGLGAGTAAVLSRVIGEGDESQLRRLTSDGLLLSITVVALFVLVGMFTIDPLFRALGARGQVLVHIRAYMEIWYPGMIAVVVPMVGNNAIRATGDTKTPRNIMLLAVLINGLLDPVLIFGWGPIPALGIRGAAIATVFARATTLTASLLILSRREKMLSFTLPKRRELLSSWKLILFLGVPAAAANMIRSAAMGVINRMVAAYGNDAVAGVGVAMVLDSIFLAMVMALATVLGPFIGQNWGRGKPERIREGVRQSLLFSLLWGGVVFVALLFLARPIATLFGSKPAVVDTIQRYLHILSLSYGLQGVILICIFAFNALHRPFRSSGLSLLWMVVLYIPLAALGSDLFQLTGIFWAGTLAALMAGTIAWIWLRSYLKILPPVTSSGT